MRHAIAIVAALYRARDVRAQAPDLGSANVVPIQITGDPATLRAGRPRRRLHGGRHAEVPGALDKHLNILWSIEPFRSYRNYFNVYAVEIARRSRASTAIRRCASGARRRCGCSSAAAARTSTRAGSPCRRQAEAQRAAVAARATPNVDQILIIANSDTYGGIGGRLATTTGGNALSPLITPHEIGHSLGGLPDEYTYSARGRPGGSYTGDEPATVHTTLLTEERDARPAEEVVALARRAERGGRPDRPLRGRIGQHQGHLAAEQALDDDLARLLLRSGQPRAHDAADRGAHGADRRVDAHRRAGRTRDVLWIDPAHPVYHELDITWRVGDTILPEPRNRPYLDLVPPRLRRGQQTSR